MRAARRAEVAYAWPVISAVIAPAHGPTLVGVVGQAERHEQRAEVGVAEPELAEAPGGLADLLGRVVGVADEDLLGDEDDLDGGAERSTSKRRPRSSSSQEASAG